MMWFKKILLRWTQDAIKSEVADKPVMATDWASPGMPKNPAQLGGEQNFVVSMRKAVNGTVLELGTHKPNRNGPDWTYEYFVVPDGESIPDAVTALLVNQRLKQ